ncbi:hypothetical protein ACFQ3Z_01880 [Streptomyces nogalater]
MGSGGGMATVGFYGAGKAALDSVSEALARRSRVSASRSPSCRWAATTPVCSPPAPRPPSPCRGTSPCARRWRRCGATP